MDQKRKKRSKKLGKREERKKIPEKRKKIFFLVVFGVIIIALILLLTLPSLNKPINKSTNKIEKTVYTLNYEIYADGKVYESKSNISIIDAKLSEKIGLKSNKVDAYLEKAKIGSSFNVSLDVNESYGEYKPELRKVVPRTIKQNRTIKANYSGTISKEEFVQAFNQEPIVNESYYNPQISPFSIKVIDVGTNVKFVFDVKVGDKTKPSMLGFWLEVVDIDKTAEKMVLRVNGNSTQLPTPVGLLNFSFDENYVYLTLTPEIGKTINWANQTGKAVSYNETSIVLDDNHPLAGKNIVIKVKVLNITKESYSGS